jgi:hypothetical protein
MSFLAEPGRGLGETHPWGTGLRNLGWVIITFIIRFERT